MKISAKKNGFTLIELMIAVAIVAILASVAYGSYQNSIQKSRRADAKNALATAVNMQEKKYLLNNQYSDIIADLGGASSPERAYAMSVAFSMGGTACADGQCYTLTATAQGPQVDDTECATFSMDNLGRKFAENSGGDDTADTCW